MLGVHTRVVCHFLVVNPSEKIVAQRKWKVGERKRVSIIEEVSKLEGVDFNTNKI